MHTFKADNGTVFNYNSDFSGNIIIHKGKEGDKRDKGDEEGEEEREIEIPGIDILQFVAYCYVFSKKIEKLEDATWQELFDKC